MQPVTVTVLMCSNLHRIAIHNVIDSKLLAVVKVTATINVKDYDYLSTHTGAYVQNITCVIPPTVADRGASQRRSQISLPARTSRMSAEHFARLHSQKIATQKGILGGGVSDEKLPH